jgi:ubiquinone biosynthesis accessory factor UbiJ
MKFILNNLQKALNAYLALDPETVARLETMQGKLVKIELLAVNLEFYLAFQANSIQVMTESLAAPNTIIKGTPLRLLQMAITKKNRQQFFSDDITIEGDLDLGQKVNELFDHLDIDWEEHLSKLIGDIPANFIGRFAKQALAFNQQLRETLCLDINEYVHEEINWFPSKEALNDFFQDIDNIRMDVDRLDARIQHLGNVTNPLNKG